MLEDYGECIASFQKTVATVRDRLELKVPDNLQAVLTNQPTVLPRQAQPVAVHFCQQAGLPAERRGDRELFLANQCTAQFLTSSSENCSFNTGPLTYAT